MSLLTEEKKTVIEGNILTNSLIYLGSPLTGGLIYKKVVSAPITPGVDAEVLLDVETNEPINLYNQVILSIVMQSDPVLVGSTPGTIIQLGLKTEPTTGGSFNNFYNTDLSAINSKQYYEFSDGYESGTTTTTDYPYMAVQVSSGTGTVTSGKLIVSLIVVDIPLL